MTSRKPMARKKPVAIVPDEEIEYVSKSELKRDAQDVRALGVEIAELSIGQRKKLDLDEELLHAFSLADKIVNTREAYRRQLQFIGRLLRNRDTDALRAGIDKLTNVNKQAERYLMKIEKLRTKLLVQDSGNDGNEGNTTSDELINQLSAEYPDMERQKLRQLVKKTHKQQLQHPEQTSSAYRELYQYLKEIIREDDNA